MNLHLIQFLQELIMIIMASIFLKLLFVEMVHQDLEMKIDMEHLKLFLRVG